MLVTSASNPRLKQLRASLRSGGPDAQSRVRIEGLKLIGEAIQSRLQIEEVFVSEGWRRDAGVQALLRLIPGRQIVEVSDQLFAKIANTESPQGLLALARMPDIQPDRLVQEASLLVVGCELQDPGNLGTLLRSAEAFGAEGVFLTQASVNPWNDKVIRASAGSVFRVPCRGGFESIALLHNLEQHGFRLVAATPKSSGDFRLADYQGRFALIVGNEGRGLSEEILNRVSARIRIPMTTAVESLNVSVAASIILCEAARQRTG